MELEPPSQDEGKWIHCSPMLARIQGITGIYGEFREKREAHRDISRAWANNRKREQGISTATRAYAGDCLSKAFLVRESQQAENKCARGNAGAHIFRS